MKLKEYLIDKIVNIFIFICTLLIVLMLTWSFSLTWYNTLILEGVLIISFIFLLSTDYLTKKRYYDDLIDTFNHLDEKSYLTEVIKPPYFYEGRLFYRLLKQTNKYANDQIVKHQVEMDEYKQYIETWIHEVKTPIATSRLLIENHKNITTLSIEEEIDKIDQFLEQVLYYVKSGSVESDYHIREVSLKEMILKEVKKHAKSMINVGCRPVFNELDYQILTDPKWSSFMIGQIITNSLKYRKEKPVIEFSAQPIDNMIYLSIRDNGIGIDCKDITRVFDKGFTGENGRLRAKSTGMGLYLCKELCQKMGIELQIESTLHEGTTVTFVFRNVTTL